MKWRRYIGVLMFAMVAAAPPLSRSPAADAAPVLAGASEVPSGLSIMTYNVKGLPWPVATGRPSALAAIGKRLAEMRRHGTQPHLVLLQEAFTSDAKAIGRIGGYHFAANGPQTDAVSQSRTEPLGESFARNSSWLKGETEGKWLDSGLVLLSDYPIVSVKRYAFPYGACAGFDCLAAKGVLLARVRIPGIAQPLTIASTHLNSRRHAGVPRARADKAFAWQLDAATAFVDANVSRDEPIVFGGDFNFGVAPSRLRLAKAGDEPLPGAKEGLRLAMADGLVATDDTADARAIIAHGSDRQYFRSGSQIRLSVTNVSVPFGTEADGSQLSDHMGFVTEYGISEPHGAPSIADASP